MDTVSHRQTDRRGEGSEVRSAVCNRAKAAFTGPWAESLDHVGPSPQSQQQDPLQNRTFVLRLQPGYMQNPCRPPLEPTTRQAQRSWELRLRSERPQFCGENWAFLLLLRVLQRRTGGRNQRRFCGNRRSSSSFHLPLKPKNAASNCSAAVFIGTKCLYLVWVTVRRSCSVGVNSRECFHTEDRLSNSAESRDGVCTS